MKKEEQLIAVHREKDARFLRNFFISVVNNKELQTNATGIKAQVEAGKNLARLQHLLQVDKEVIRASKRPTIEKPALRAEHQKELDKILNAK